MSESSKGAHAVAEQPAVTSEDAEKAHLALVPGTGAGLPPTAQTFFAVVESTGVLVRGFGTVSAARLATGQYQVVFSHDVSRSGFIASQGFTGSLNVPPDGTAVCAGRTGVPNGVFVATYNTAGVHTDRSFHLTVKS
jgi:hypothetical protein